METEDARFLQFCRSMAVIQLYLSSGNYPVDYNENQKRCVQHTVGENKFKLEGDQLFHKKGERYLKVVTDLKERNRIISQYHKPAKGGHSCITRVIYLISQRYWWNGLKKDIRNYISKCKACHKKDMLNRHLTDCIYVDNEKFASREKLEEKQPNQQTYQQSGEAMVTSATPCDSNSTESLRSDSREPNTISQRESCLHDIYSLLPDIGEVAVNAEESDLLALRSYLQEFLKCNRKDKAKDVQDTFSNSHETQKNSPVCGEESAEKKVIISLVSRPPVDCKTVPEEQMEDEDEPFLMALQETENKGLENEVQDHLINTSEGETADSTKKYKMVFVINRELYSGINQIAPQVAYAVVGLYKEIIGNAKNYETITKEWEKSGQKKVFYYGTDSQELSCVQHKTVSQGLPTCLVQNSSHISTVVAFFIEESLTASIVENLELIDMKTQEHEGGNSSETKNAVTS